jgi:oligopeptide/dipeptide ABC transporter ATP-binding protein
MVMPDQDNLVLEVKSLKTYFQVFEGVLKAVDGVSFSIKKGRTLGIIGESGCGKSVTAQSILRIVPSAGRIEAGEILFHRTGPNGTAKIVDLAGLDARGEMIRQIRGREISMIFQEPMTSFGPVHTIGSQIVEAIRLHMENMGKRQAKEQAIQFLDRVGIPKARETVDAYPHQLSGGMRQRAMIAMALCCNPSLLIADEPTTALDVTIQAQILELLRQLQRELGMAMLYITHNLSVIAGVAHEVAVMYLGRIVEYASVEEIFDNPTHPYTVALWRSIPRLEGKLSRLESIKGTVPSPFGAQRGCPFYSRCEVSKEGLCDKAFPEMTEVHPGHRVWCFHYRAGR